MILRIKQYKFYVLICALAIMPTMYTQTAQDKQNTENYSHEEDAEFDLEALLEDPERLNSYLADHEDLLADGQESDGYSFITTPEFIINMQEWFDREVLSKYPDQREQAINKIAALDRFIRHHSSGRLNLIALSPWLMTGSSVMLAFSVAYSIAKCCRVKVRG